MYSTLFFNKSAGEGLMITRHVSKGIIESGETKLSFWKRTFKTEGIASTKSTGGIVCYIEKK